MDLEDSFTLSEVQDPGNAGTILRCMLDAFGMDAVITSPGSVDMYSPKVVRSTAGSLWHIPVFESSLAIEDLVGKGSSTDSTLGATGSKSLNNYVSTGDTVAIFGNESRGLTTSEQHSQWHRECKYPDARQCRKPQFVCSSLDCYVSPIKYPALIKTVPDRVLPMRVEEISSWVEDARKAFASAH